ncbi:site-specific integrase [Streptomonospora sediminis]
MTSIVGSHRQHNADATTKEGLDSMTDSEGAPKKSRGRRGEGSIHWDERKKCYVGSISLGYDAIGRRRRPKVYGATKTEVRSGMRKLRNEAEAGAKTSARYTVADAVNDWLEAPNKRRSADTVEQYRSLAKVHLLNSIGRLKLRDLEADDIDEWLADRAERLATSVVNRLLWMLRAAIKHALRRGKVIRNVADVVEAPEGQQGRPSKALNLAQARALLAAAREYALHAYIVVSLTTGIRTEEARALRWEHVDLEGDPGAAPPVPPFIAVWRSDRVGGETKTRKSKRTLALPALAVNALKQRKAEQERERAAAGSQWVENGLVFCTGLGKQYSRFHAYKLFTPIVKRAGLENWTPRELRHSFVSLMSADGVQVEDIARLVGHSTTLTTETYYRRELRPVITEGADRMDIILGTETTPSETDSDAT